MAARNFQELGVNLQKIVQHLMSNNNLIKLLYNENIDPLSVEISPEVKNNKIFNNLIRIVPKVGTKDNAKSMLAVYISSGQNLSENNEYK